MVIRAVWTFAPRTAVTIRPSAEHLFLRRRRVLQALICGVSQVVAWALPNRVQV